ncbi:MAG: aminopeptidase [Xanthomonadales bacterium]|nr:aminopeptidase [Xanthomonadales bacterium]
MILRLLLVLCLTACSGPSYYLQAMSGQNKLMKSRQDIQSLLDDPATPEELAGHLKTAEQIKEFAQDELDLPLDGSYSSYVEVEGEALVWNVVATGEFSLQPKKWCFLVAGCVPYRGFFAKQKARKSADRLSQKGMDVIVSPAAAYSSLGWFNDPLLSTMFSDSDSRLAAYLFHELAHQRLYNKNDGLFNEGYANFVEQAGVRSWLEFKQRPDELKRWQQLQEVSSDFSSLVGKSRTDLYKLYHSNQTETAMRQQKAEIFASLEHDYHKLSNEKWQGKRYYSSWFKEPLNNARLALYNTYEGSHCAFQRLWDQSGGNWQKFHQLAEQKSSLQKDERREWLNQTCPEIAPQTDL